MVLVAVRQVSMGVVRPIRVETRSRRVPWMAGLQALCRAWQWPAGRCVRLLPSKAALLLVLVRSAP
jgi:hypothetical protein